MNVKILSFTSQKELNWPMFLQIVLNQISVKTWDIQVEKIKGRRQNDQRTAPKRSKDAAKKIKGRRKKDQRMPPKRSKDAAKKIKWRHQIVKKSYCAKILPSNTEAMQHWGHAIVRPCDTEAMPKWRHATLRPCNTEAMP